MPNIQLTPVTGSSLIAADGWDESRTTLVIQFHGGKAYQYSGLSPQTHAAYEAAPSKGKYFSQHIKPNVSGILIS